MGFEKVHERLKQVAVSFKRRRAWFVFGFLIFPQLLTGFQCSFTQIWRDQQILKATTQHNRAHKTEKEAFSHQHQERISIYAQDKMKLTEKELDDFAFEVQRFQAGPHSTYSNPATIEINAAPDVVCQAYVDFTWKLGGGFGLPTVFREGRPDGEGLIRSPGYGLLEKITRVEKGKIVEYSIPRGLPLTSHLGVVNFEPIGDGSSSTKVTWVIHYTPRWYGTWFGIYCEKVLFPFFLRNLKAEVEQKSQE